MLLLQVKKHCIDLKNQVKALGKQRTFLLFMYISDLIVDPRPMDVEQSNLGR